MSCPFVLNLARHWQEAAHPLASNGRRYWSKRVGFRCWRVLAHLSHWATSEKVPCCQGEVGIWLSPTRGTRYRKGLPFALVVETTSCYLRIQGSFEKCS